MENYRFSIIMSQTRRKLLILTMMAAIMKKKHRLIELKNDLECDMEFEEDRLYIKSNNFDRFVE